VVDDDRVSIKEKSGEKKKDSKKKKGIELKECRRKKLGKSESAL
jgi:hypothetical protein